MGDINSSHCYDLCEVEFACCDGSGGVSLTNITTINGAPPGSGGGLPTNAAPPNMSIQFNTGGAFTGSANLTWDNVNQQLNVIGYVNATNCYLVNNIPFACYDSVSGGIDLSNITNINGSAYPPPTVGPAPPNMSVQWNNNGVFGGSAQLLYDDSVAHLEMSADGNPGLYITETTNSRSGSLFVDQVGYQMVAGANTAIYLYSPDLIEEISHGSMMFEASGTAGPAFQFGTAASDSAILVMPNNFVGINLPNTLPAYTLDVNGDVNSTGCYRINGIPFACTDGGTGVNLYNITDINGSPYPPPAGSTVTVSDTPPANPSQGNLWFDSGDTQLYIWYQDPNSGQWVPTINQCSGGAAAPTPPAPPNMSVQWNNNGVFGGSGLLIWNNSTTQLGVGTGTPAYTLDVVGALGGPTEYVARVLSTDTFCGFIIENSGGQGSGGESIISFRSQGVETAVISYDDDEDALIFWTGGRDAGLSTLCCDTNSRVGIRTTSPVSALQVFAIDSSTLVTFGDDAGPNSIDFLAIADSNNGYNDISFNLYFDGLAWHLRNSAYDGWLLGISTNNVTGGNFTIAHSPSGSVNLTNFISVSSSGNVGIGVTPNDNIDTSGARSLQMPTNSYFLSGNIGSNLAYYEVGGSFNWRYPSTSTNIGYLLQVTPTALYLNIAAPNSGAPDSVIPSLTIPMVWGSNGNVGIGTATPATRLEVDGNVTFRADYNSVSISTSQLLISGSSNTAQFLALGFDTGIGQGIIQAGVAGVGWNTLAINPNGGTVTVNGTPIALISQAMWDALTTRIQTLEARLGG